jgi:hypothetical protein
MIYQLTFKCGVPTCDKTAVAQCEAQAGETPDELRKRNPIFVGVNCAANHAGSYPAEGAREIVPFP